MAAPLVSLQKDFVGQHVELLLHFALHVLGLHAAEYAAQSTFGHLMADGLAGPCHHFDKEAQIGGSVVATGLLDQIATQGNAGHGRLREGRKIARSLTLYGRRRLLPPPVGIYQSQASDRLTPCCLSSSPLRRL
ncbi:hypothetical protein D9M68_697120 [compost metagenome]